MEVNQAAGAQSAWAIGTSGADAADKFVSSMRKTMPDAKLWRYSAQMAAKELADEQARKKGKSKMPKMEIIWAGSAEKTRQQTQAVARALAQQERDRNRGSSGGGGGNSSPVVGMSHGSPSRPQKARLSPTGPVHAWTPPKVDDTDAADDFLLMLQQRVQQQAPPVPPPGPGLPSRLRTAPVSPALSTHVAAQRALDFSVSTGAGIDLSFDDGKEDKKKTQPQPQPQLPSPSRQVSSKVTPMVNPTVPQAQANASTMVPHLHAEYEETMTPPPTALCAAVPDSPAVRGADADAHADAGATVAVADVANAVAAASGGSTRGGAARRQQRNSVILANNARIAKSAQLEGRKIALKAAATERARRFDIRGRGLRASDCVGMAKGLLAERTITAFDAAENFIGDEGCIALAPVFQCEFVSLATIDLASNDIGNRGVRALANALRDNEAPALQHLVLSWNQFGDDGAVALAGALEHNEALRSTLRVAEMCGNAVRGRGAQALVQACLSAAALRAEQAGISEREEWTRCAGGVTLDLKQNQVDAATRAQLLLHTEGVHSDDIGSAGAGSGGHRAAADAAADATLHSGADTDIADIVAAVTLSLDCQHSAELCRSVGGMKEKEYAVTKATTLSLFGRA